MFLHFAFSAILYSAGQMSTRTMLSGFYAISRWPPQKHKIEVLLNFELLHMYGCIETSKYSEVIRHQLGQYLRGISQKAGLIALEKFIVVFMQVRLEFESSKLLLIQIQLNTCCTKHALHSLTCRKCIILKHIFFIAITTASNSTIRIIVLVSSNNNSSKNNKVIWLQKSSAYNHNFTMYMYI